MNPFRPLSISLSPNVQKDDLFLALKLLFSPWKWKVGDSQKKLEEAFRQFVEVKSAVAFNSGRSALFAILQAFYVKEGDEILVQAFTCSAACAPILWGKARPVYVDIDDETFTMDPFDLETKITEKSRGIIVQHTFGIPSNMEAICRVARKHNLFVIEDCAHALGSEYQGKKVGSFGDAAFFSFGRDKPISCVYGGIAVSKSAKVGEKLCAISEESGLPNFFWILQQLWHPLWISLILPFYYFLNFGKILLILLQKLHILSLAISIQEKSGFKPSYFPKKLPNALATLALHQFQKLPHFVEHRKELAMYYERALQSLRIRLLKRPSGTIFLRYPIVTPRACELIKKARHQHILLGDWYDTVIAPQSVNLEVFMYKNGSCPHAQRVCEQVFNLPTSINTSKEDAKRITHFLTSAYESPNR